MSKYNIEGGINFFEELYKSLDVEENEEKTDDDNNKCLITNQILGDKHVSLMCGHKFNYIPLYNDILNHKKKFNYLEASAGKLATNEIRCPYCRKKQTGVLPYYEELGLEKVNGVNMYDPSVKAAINYSKGNKCEFQLPNSIYNPDIPESETNVKFVVCGSYYSTKIAVYNPLNSEMPINYGDNKYYCYHHKREMIKKYKLLEKEKKKEEVKQLKSQQKAEKEKVKEEEKVQKQKEKEEMKQIKKQIKKALKSHKNVSTAENLVLGPLVIENETSNNLCSVILKTGPRKGLNCGCKVIENATMCKRHYTLNNNNNNNDNN